MELQAVLVLCGVGVAGAAVLLLMGLFSTSGTSYEEAMAQQRRATTELLALAESKNKPKKNVKKANKKLAKKEKRESTAVSSSDHESEVVAESGGDEESTSPSDTANAAVSPRPHVEFKPAVVMEVPKDTLPNIKIRKRGKDPKVKPILLNKEDPSCVSDPSSPPSPAASVSNHFEEIHPKDEFELMHATLNADKVTEKKEESSDKKDAKSKQTRGKSASGPAEVDARDKNNGSDAHKDNKKGKKSEKRSISDDNTDGREESVVVAPLNAPQPSELTTEKLLKQALAAVPTGGHVTSPPPSLPPASVAHHTPPGKGKKNKKQEPNVMTLLAEACGGGVGVSVASLVRLVNEAALSRTELQLLTDTLLNKQHDALPLHSEWTEGPNDPMQKLKKQLADKEKALIDETEASQALHAKLKELRTSLNAERARAAAAAAELRALQLREQRLMDEHRALRRDHALLQSKLAAEADAQAQRVQMEMHLQRLSESETALMGQLAAVQAEAAARALEAGQARCEAGAAREAVLHAQQHAADLAHQLQEANRVCAELDAQRQNAIHAETAAQQEIRQLQDRLNKMEELQAEMQRLTNRAQVVQASADVLKDESEKHMLQLSAELLSVQEQLSIREAEIAELKQMKATSPAQNGLPPSNLTDQHKVAELAKVEGIIDSLRAELATAQRGCNEQKEQVARLREQLNTYQDKNNELRTKNWKVMEALQSAEKALQSKLPNALSAQDSLRESATKAQETHYNEVASILNATFPSVTPPAPPGPAWLETFAAALKKELEDAKSTPVTTQPPQDDRLSELQAQNEHLQGLVDKYKTIIDDTEGVLSRLQQNVTAEEQRWARQLADKQRELDALTHTTLTQEPLAFAYSCIEKTLPTIMAEMQNKIDSLQLELRQAQAANHNNSFADAERLTEERLMGGLADKQKFSSSNGPLQVTLEEK